jgi:hypothetical protein
LPYLLRIFVAGAIAKISAPQHLGARKLPGGWFSHKQRARIAKKKIKCRRIVVGHKQQPTMEMSPNITSASLQMLNF